jgi:hypothetical protein
MGHPREEGVPEMREVYKALWLLFAVGLFALVDLRLPEHGFADVQASDWWQVLKIGTLYVLLPYLALRLFEIVVVGKNHAQIGKLPSVQTDLPTADNPPATLDNTQQPALPNQQEMQQASWQLAVPKPIEGLPIPATDLDRDLVQAVLAYLGEGSYNKAANRLQSMGVKITGEGVRQRVIKAYEERPEWVMEVLPHDKLPKV